MRANICFETSSVPVRLQHSNSLNAQSESHEIADELDEVFHVPLMSVSMKYGMFFKVLEKKLLLETLT